MHLIFLHGPPAAGKLTIGRMVADQTGFALFHNHLVVDAVAAVFPFGTAEFIRLRERFWLETIEAAVRDRRSLIFTFAPEPTVAGDFPQRLCQMVEHLGGKVWTIALDVDGADQERRLVATDRAQFGKLRSLELLAELRPGIVACVSAMPAATLRIDTSRTLPDGAATTIVRLIAAAPNDQQA